MINHLFHTKILIKLFTEHILIMDFHVIVQGEVSSKGCNIYIETRAIYH
jgi:hypothetical protein